MVGGSEAVGGTSPVTVGDATDYSKRERRYAATLRSSSTSASGRRAYGFLGNCCRIHELEV
jgi:hypothetical protein